MKRSRFISKIKYPSISIIEGSVWIRKLNIPVINHPLVIMIKKKMDLIGFRYQIINKDNILYFDRETVIENYEPRTSPEIMPIDWQIGEIKGYRFHTARGEVWARGNYENAPDMPATLVKAYSNNQNYANELLVEMGSLFPEFKNYMGGIEMLIKQNGKILGFKDKTKPLVICKAYLELFS